MERRIKEVVILAIRAEDMTADDIGDDLPLFESDGLGLDSVDALEVAVELERAFDVVLPDDDRSVFRSVRTLADHIRGALEAAS